MVKHTKKKKSSPVAETEDPAAELAKDPIPPVVWVPPQAALGQKLLEAIEYRPLEEKDLYGMKISLRALKNLSTSEIRDLVEVFQTFDRTSSGILKPAELFYAMKSLGFNTTQSTCESYVRNEVAAAVEEASSSSKAKFGLNLNQFLDLVIDKQYDSKDEYDELVTGFNMFDIDNTGLLSMESLRRACQETGVQLSDAELHDMILEADLNGDGFVDQHEFISVMLKTNLYSS